MKEGRGCYERRRVGERWGFERRRRGEGGTVEGFGRGRTGGEAVGNTRGKESLDVSKEMGRRRGGEMEVGLRGRRRGSWRAVWMKVSTAGSKKIETYCFVTLLVNNLVVRVVVVFFNLLLSLVLLFALLMCFFLVLVRTWEGGREDPWLEDEED